ncbi:uncharacterized protein LOC117283843 [Fukomys damarensis]|uniref:uncharacterized protein LOC117283843 n=1 Tax=Fukomys damarensis TaxID=885580 RepID=UPI00053FC6B2|nr:uncharacterized protein LOC117283843 [Fukomys damarensis]
MGQGWRVVEAPGVSCTCSPAALNQRGASEVSRGPAPPRAPLSFVTPNRKPTLTFLIFASSFSLVGSAIRKSVSVCFWVRQINAPSSPQAPFCFRFSFCCIDPDAAKAQRGGLRLSSTGWRRQGGGERQSERFTQSAYTPSDNRPIRVRRAWGRAVNTRRGSRGGRPEPEAQHQTQLSESVRGARGRSEPGRRSDPRQARGCLTFPPQLGSEEAASGFSKAQSPRLQRPPKNFAEFSMCGARWRRRT